MNDIKSIIEYYEQYSKTIPQLNDSLKEMKEVSKLLNSKSYKELISLKKEKENLEKQLEKVAKKNKIQFATLFSEANENNFLDAQKTLEENVDDESIFIIKNKIDYQDFITFYNLKNDLLEIMKEISNKNIGDDDIKEAQKDSDENEFGFSEED